MDERLVEVFKGYVTKEHVAVLLCGNLRRIHLHLTQIFATTNFLFNLVEQLFKKKPKPGHLKKSQHTN